jgi:signal recognition particle receptor subunit beta
MENRAMAFYDHPTKTIHVKLVYYGLAMSGKSTSMAAVHRQLRPDLRTDIQSEVTEMCRTISFHCIPDDPAPMAGYTMQVQVVTVPGTVLYAATRTASLDHADGVLFVADSQRDRFQGTMSSLQELANAMQAAGRSLRTLPVVLQYTKRDIPDVLPSVIIDSYLNPLRWPRFESQMIGPWRAPRWQPEQLAGAEAPFHTLCHQIMQQLAASN